MQKPRRGKGVEVEASASIGSALGVPEGELEFGGRLRAADSNSPERNLGAD